MKKYLLLNNLINFVREYIFIFLTATIFLFSTSTKSFSDENVFIINNVEIEGVIDLNFSREKYLDNAFLDSFEILMTRVLLSRDLKKVSERSHPKKHVMMSRASFCEANFTHSCFTNSLFLAMY